MKKGVQLILIVGFVFLLMIGFASANFLDDFLKLFTNGDDPGFSGRLNSLGPGKSVTTCLQIDIVNNTKIDKDDVKKFMDEYQSDCRNIRSEDAFRVIKILNNENISKVCNENNNYCELNDFNFDGSMSPIDLLILINTIKACENKTGSPNIVSASDFNKDKFVNARDREKFLSLLKDYPLGTVCEEGVTCEDSDGGKNYSSKGNTTNVEHLGGYFPEEDKCSKDFSINHSSYISDPNLLYEYYCKPRIHDGQTLNVGDTEIYVCPNGCKDGACINSSSTQEVKEAALGNEQAKVTIIAYSEYECPFCGGFSRDTLPQLKKEYIDTGKVKFVFKDFPLKSIHPYAQKASEAAKCAGVQGKYFAMHDKLFANQKNLNVTSLKKYAQDIGLDVNKFNTCLDSGAMVTAIQKDSTEATNAGARGVPYFMINGVAVSGAHPFVNFKLIIDKALKKEGVINESQEIAKPKYVILEDFGVIKSSGVFESGREVDDIDYLSTLFDNFVDGESIQYFVGQFDNNIHVYVVIAEYNGEIGSQEFKDKIREEVTGEYVNEMIINNNRVLFYSFNNSNNQSGLVWTSKNKLVHIYFQDGSLISGKDGTNLIKAYQNKFPSTFVSTDLEQPVEQSCQLLIEQVKNPRGFSVNGIEYVSGYSSNRSSYYLINDQKRSFMRYTVEWSYNPADSQGRDLLKRIMVFDDVHFDAGEYIKNELSEVDICKSQSFFVQGVEQEVYVCDNSLERSIYGHKIDVYWANDNVIIFVRFSLDNDETDEFIQQQENLFELFDKLQDNKADYVSASPQFDYAQRLIIEQTLALCGSSLEISADNVCTPYWECKTEPLLCPPHGEQTRTCVDSNCNSESIVQKEYCSPGICSGCYVPRESGREGDNICIPYGTRFMFDEKESYRFYETEMNEEGDGYFTVSIYPRLVNISVIKDVPEGVTLTVNGVNYYLKTGEQKTIRKGERYEVVIYDNDREYEESYSLLIKDIHYSEDASQRYIEVTFNYEYAAYCNYDGKVRQQKTIDSEGSWASCQNNYECESNVCSSGECVEVTQFISKAGGLKALFFKAICRMAHIFSQRNYEQCVINNLG